MKQGAVDWSFDLMSDDSAGSSPAGPGRLTGVVCSDTLTATLTLESGDTDVVLTYGDTDGGWGCD